MAILCNSFTEVMGAFTLFMDYLEHCYPMDIETIYEYGYAVTAGGVHYIFTCYEFEDALNKSGYESIDMDEFFEGVIDDFTFIMEGGKL